MLLRFSSRCTSWKGLTAMVEPKYRIEQLRNSKKPYILSPYHSIIGSHTVLVSSLHVSDTIRLFELVPAPRDDDAEVREEAISTR
jgi:hypothetical protein